MYNMQHMNTSDTLTKPKESMLDDTTYQVVEALDTVYDDLSRLAETHDSLLRDCKNNDDVDTLHALYVADSAPITERYQYALRAVAGRKLDRQFVNDAVATYFDTKSGVYSAAPNCYEEKERQDQESRRKARIAGVIGTASMVPVAAIAHMDVRQSYVEQPQIVLADEPAIKIRKAMPDSERPGRYWVSMTDPRTVEVGPRVQDHIVVSHRVIDHHPDTDRAGEVVTWCVDRENQSVYRRDPEQIRRSVKEVVVEGITYKMLFGQVVRSLTDNEDGSLTVTTIPPLSVTRVSEESDTHLLAEAGTRLHMIIPGGRKSLMEYNGVDEFYAYLDADRTLEESFALETAIQEVRGDRTSVLETFRPLTGISGGSLNPRPLPVAKRN